MLIFITKRAHPQTQIQQSHTDAEYALTEFFSFELDSNVSCFFDPLQFMKVRSFYPHIKNQFKQGDSLFFGFRDRRKLYKNGLSLSKGHCWNAKYAIFTLGFSVILSHGLPGFVVCLAVVAIALSTSRSAISFPFSCLASKAARWYLINAGSP